MKKIMIAAMLSSALLAGACTSTGNKVLKEETQETVATKLSPGMTQDEVQAIFGQPLDTTYTDSGNEIWKYSFSKTKLKAKSFIPYYGLLDSGAKGDAKTLTIFFDTTGRLVRHSMTSSKIDTDTGIFN